MSLRNWAGNVAYAAARVHRPETVDEIRAIVRGCRAARPLGTRHAFNRIADTPGDLICLERCDRIVDFDPDRRTVTVEGGVRYAALGAFLHARGFALPNLASLPHISVAGAVATGTHGSGDRLGSLATHVRAVEIVTAADDLISLHADRDPEFFGAVVSLGALGVVVRLTLDLVPAFDVAQTVYENLPWDALETRFDAIFGGAYSVSAFTDWREGVVPLVWRKAVAGEAWEGDLFGAAPVAADRHPIDGVSAESCTPQCGVPGPWHERLPHFRPEFTPSRGDELQSEFFVPRADAVAALRAVADLRASIAPLLWISEIRTVAADALWLSPAYARDVVGIHFTWKPQTDAVEALLPRIEDALAPFDPRPHWGKCFAAAPRPSPRADDFLALARRLDPEGVFRNAFLDTAFAG